MNEKKFHVGIKALVQNEEGKVLLLKVDPRELRDNEHGVYWDLPGGRIKHSDSVETTLRKELEEEIGYAGGIEIIKPLHGGISRIEIPVDGERYGLVLFVYLCRINGLKEITLSFEHTEYGWFSIEEVKQLLSVKFSKEFIEKLDEIDWGKVM